jgi:type II secretory pathway pseudopilin PulG
MKNLNNSAFTLLEILLATIIFIISIAGVFATLNAVRQPVIDKESALTATIFGKQVLEALRSQVNAATSSNYYSDSTCTPTCSDFSLGLGTHQVNTTNLPSTLTWPTALTSSNQACATHNPCLVYTVSCADGSPNSSCGADIARKVDLSINWPSSL